MATTTLASRAAPPLKAAGPPPNQTLYVRGLPEKLKKDALRRELYLLFSTYGPVLDIVTLKTMKMRGQAHIVFRDIQSASMAMRACSDMEFHGNTLTIQYGRGKSQKIAKLDGTFKPPAPEKPPTAPPPKETQKAKAPVAKDASAQRPRTAATANGEPRGTKRVREEDEPVDTGTRAEKEEPKKKEPAPQEEESDPDAMDISSGEEESE